MPPCIDIYGITERRDEIILQNFLDQYCDRERSEGRGDESLEMFSLAASENPEPFGWVETKILPNAISLGINFPQRCFTLYLYAQNDYLNNGPMCGVIIRFTPDNKLILGVRVDDTSEKEKTLELAKYILDDLITNHHCHKGIILYEMPPPETEYEFDQFMKENTAYSKEIM